MRCPSSTPEESHKAWLKEKEATGWKYGKLKDVTAKEHPCMVAYSDLPASQQLKDKLLIQVAKTLVPYI